MMSDETKQLRDVVTGHFSRQQFDAGIRALGQANLPEPVRLECLGNLHFYRRELQQAIACYEAAIGMAADYGIARYQYLVGVQQEKTGNFVDAFERYQNAIEIEPTFVDAYVELGGLLVKVEDLAGALKCYRDAVRVDPSDVANHHNLKAILTRLVDTDPQRYAAELAAAEAAYEIARTAGCKELPKYQW